MALADTYPSQEGETEDVVFYTVNDALESQMVDFIRSHKDQLNYREIKNITWKTSIEEWLHRIQTCKFFVTDSFHGSCFAIFFNKPFVCINTNTVTSTRMASVFDDLNVKGRLYSAFEDVDFASLLANAIDYESVNQNIENVRVQSTTFLLNALEASYDNRIPEKERLANEYQELSCKVCEDIYRLYHRKYWRYRLLSYLTFGKKRRKYKEKKKDCRLLYKKAKARLRKYKS